MAYESIENATMNELGDLRPSQLIFTFGVGSLVDLPNMSALIMGLDDWDTRYCKEIEEDRLVAAVQKRLGAQMSKLYLPPIKLDGTDRDPAAPAVGVPVVPFPRWMRCSICDTLASVESGVFKTHIGQTERSMFTRDASGAEGVHHLRRCRCDFCSPVARDI